MSYWPQSMCIPDFHENIWPGICYIEIVAAGCKTCVELANPCIPDIKKL